MPSVEKIEPVVESKVTAMGFELYGIKFFNTGKYSILRVFVDKPGGIHVEDCEMVSRELGIVLDVENFSKGSYTLEVSSPGTDWPLKNERDYNRVTGRNVTIRMNDDYAEAKKITGKVEKCEDGLLTLTDSNKNITVPLSSISTGKVEITFK